MAFLRFSRDKRGYEHVYLVQPAGRRGKSSPRLLYWFRTPPNVKVGREPFDESVRRSLEAQHPDVAFNWPRLLATPFPPPDTERWRERRRERAARRVAEAEVDVAPNPESEASLERPSNPENPSSVSAGPAEHPARPGNTEDSEGHQAANEDAQSSEPGGATPAVTLAEPPRRHRRRRRRRRRGAGGDEAAAGASTLPETKALDLGRSGDRE